MHINAGDHDLLRPRAYEIDHIADHMALVTFDDAVLLGYVDQCAELCLCHDRTGVRVDSAEHQHHAGNCIYDKNDRGQDRHEQTDHAGIPEGDPLRIRGGHVLGRDLSENEDQKRQDAGDDPDRRISEKTDRQDRRQGGRRDIDYIVSDQDRGQHFCSAVRNIQYCFCPAVPFLRKSSDTDQVDGGERSLSAGKES